MEFRIPADGDDRSEGGTLLRSGEEPANRDAARIEMAKWLIWSRKLRPDTMVGSLYRDPAWDLALDLYIRQKQGLRTPVSSACLATGASVATAFRLIEQLCTIGWTERRADVRDKRRDWLHLRRQAVRRLDTYLDLLLTGPPPRVEPRDRIPSGPASPQACSFRKTRGF